MAPHPMQHSPSLQNLRRALEAESQSSPSVSAASDVMPVLRPRLPSAADILPYLEAIDERRWYSNYGPLVTRLEETLSHQLGFADRSVITAASATSALTVTLLAKRIPAGSACIMPSWTFAATPHAAIAAGLTPWFHDVDRGTWALDPHDVVENLKRISATVGAVIVVSPFGAPLDLDAWQTFEDCTGIPVIADAAAGFDTARPSRIPVVVSLHATKILGAGEGGFVATSDSPLRDRIMTCSNFGFAGSRTAMLPARNAKMSEYHAAVALAGLTNWSETRAQHSRIIDWYRQRIAPLNGVSLQPGYGNGWVAGTTSVRLPKGSAARISERLLQLGIETRPWWGQGCHVQPALADCPRGPLPITDELGGRVLGVPHFPEMFQADVEAVAAALCQVMKSGADAGLRTLSLLDKAGAAR
jgi:dTDP-4-amino-4,6-dideoxygalactose transaminase